jgi:hypothetical protein
MFLMNTSIVVIGRNGGIMTEAPYAESQTESQTEHEDLVESALFAINEVFGDTNVPRSTTKTALRFLLGEIDVMLDALDINDE